MPRQTPPTPPPPPIRLQPEVAKAAEAGAKVMDGGKKPVGIRTRMCGSIHSDGILCLIIVLYETLVCDCGDVVYGHEGPHESVDDDGFASANSRSSDSRRSAQSSCRSRAKFVTSLSKRRTEEEEAYRNATSCKSNPGGKSRFFATQFSS